jgi:hypothetical protein
MRGPCAACSGTSRSRSAQLRMRQTSKFIESCPSGADRLSRVHARRSIPAPACAWMRSSPPTEGARSARNAVAGAVDDLVPASAKTRACPPGNSCGASQPDHGGPRTPGPDNGRLLAYVEGDRGELGERQLRAGLAYVYRNRNRRYSRRDRHRHVETASRPAATSTEARSRQATPSLHDGVTPSSTAGGGTR